MEVDFDALNKSDENNESNILDTTDSKSNDNQYSKNSLSEYVVESCSDSDTGQSSSESESDYD